MAELSEHTVISGHTALLASSQQLKVREITGERAPLRLTYQILSRKDAMPLGKYFPTFRSIVVPSLSGHETRSVAKVI